MDDPTTAQPGPRDRRLRRIRAASARRLHALFTAGGPAFRDLALAHFAATAADTLVAIALAGTLFFSVPSAEARGNVLLYLGLTAAPFAVIGPALGSLLTRAPTAYRHSLVVSAAARGAVTVLMIGRTDSLWLFPLAFAVLVLSRAHGISRNALLPVTLDRPVALVTANAQLAQVGLLGGTAGAAVGVATLRLSGTTAALWLAVLSFAAATLFALQLPSPTAGPRRPSSSAGRRLPRRVRLAQLATSGVRVLNGFLLLLLAFAFHEEQARALEFGALLAAAGAGFGLAALIAPVLARSLREEPMVLSALALEAGAAFTAAQWFGLPAASALAAAAGLAWGTAKFAFDGLLQASVPEERRGVAFTWSETAFQLAWVGGALVPTGIPLPTDVGLVLAGLAALAAQVVYVAALIQPATALPADDQPAGPGPPSGAADDLFSDLPWPTP